MGKFYKTLFLSIFLILGSQHSSADILPSNYEIPTPAWDMNQVPITWGDCIPVPNTPMNIPQANIPMGVGIPFPQGIPIPAPIYDMPYNAQLNLPAPIPFFNAVPMPLPLAPDLAAQNQLNCDANDEELKELQARYDDASTASRNKIAELNQALQDTQNQISDSQKLLNTAKLATNDQQANTKKLEKQLKISEESRLNIQNKLNSIQTEITQKNNQDSKAITLLKNKISDLENTTISLKAQLNTAESNIGAQASLLTSLQQSATELTNTKSAYKERNDEKIQLKEQLAKLEGDYKSLQAQLENVKADASMQDRKLAALNQSAKELSALKKAYKARIDENMELKNKLTSLENKMTSIKASLNTKQTALKLKSAQDIELIAELKKKMNETENNNISLKTQLDTAINNAGSQAKKITALSQSSVELSAIQTAYKERSDENSELKKKLFDCETTSKTLKAQLEMATNNVAEEARKQAALSQSAAELTALKSAYKESDAENAKLKMQLNDMQSMQITIDATKAEMIELQNKLNESEDERKNLIGKISTLEKKSSDQTRKITELMVTTSGLDELKSAFKELSSNKVELNIPLEAASADTDKDGILDVSDKCPASPEGSKVNALGCTDIQDADNDGVADADDLCPASVTGTKVNDFGCEPTQNITLKGVNFTSGSAKLTSDSLPIINAAAETIKRNTNLNIDVAGYTDNQGEANVNKRLSERRANSVMIQLIKQGVDANRLTANGYGEKDPVSSNDTDEGRSTNRRVELKIRE